ncbi:hypothetical protein Bbelb_138430 [Branchiostoma belcheri]|nr:hypothetical protein Bbelb_138430 [Branchiostoma belcheri]
MTQTEGTPSTLSLQSSDTQSEQRLPPGQKGRKTASGPPKHPHSFTVRADVHREPAPPPNNEGQDMANTPPVQHHHDSFPVPAPSTENLREEKAGTHPQTTHDREAYLDTIYLQDNYNPNQHVAKLFEINKPTPKMAWY